MRKLTSVLLVAMLTFAVTALAQDAHEGEPSMSVMITEKVAPGATKEYIEGTKKWIEAINEAEIPLYFFTFSDFSGNFSYIVGIKSLGEMDSMAGLWGKAAGLLRKSDWGKARQAAVLSTKYNVLMSSRDVSYMPETPKHGPMDTPYFEYYDVRVKNANEYEFYGYMKAIKEAYVKHNIDRPYDVYRNIIGEEGPLYTIVIPATDPADYFASRNEIKKVFGNELDEIYAEMMKLVEEMSTGRGWMNWELSNVPAMQ